MIALLLSIKLKHNIFRRMCYYNPQLSVDIVTVICLLLEVKFLHLFCLTIISEYNSYNLSNAFKLLFYLIYATSIFLLNLLQWTSHNISANTPPIQMLWKKTHYSSLTPYISYKRFLQMLRTTHTILHYKDKLCCVPRACLLPIKKNVQIVICLKKSNASYDINM